MRAPRFVREFFEWRWATCVALITGAFAFIALALLLIPTQLGGARLDALQRVPPESTAEGQRAARTPVLETPGPISIPAPVPVAVAPSEAAAAEIPARPAPAPRAVPPDFASNIANRADRPQRPRERSQ